MRDPVFTGPDVEAALGAASRDLGVPRQQLRHVVLETGGAGMPARIAVLLGAPASRAPAPIPAPDVEARVRDVVRALADALGEPVEAETTAAEGRLDVRLQGAGIEWLERDGNGALEALASLLGRIGHQGPGSQRVRVAAGRDRDARLREHALDLARAVLDDGHTRRTVPLNAYERRIVHMAASEVPGVETRSDPTEGRTRPVELCRTDPPNA